ncbi:hypothetical protein HED60_04560 [Planctomycetales bacterium ZRK34]|nr:hypothetical protein HED60_04560 [Planctomycetales bacterium ZRK34]
MSNDQRQRGVILVITMLSVLLLAGLVLWVLNLGQQVNHRVTTQNTADATARAAGGWIARSLNTVAANNTDMARYIALINVLDAMPQAVDYTRRESELMLESLGNQNASGVTGSPSQLSQLVQTFYEQLYAELDEQVADIIPTDEFYKSIDVRRMTRFPDGSIWQALYGLDELNGAIMDNIGEMAQVSAVSAGRVNRITGDSAAFALPTVPTIPYRRGTFDDFERPVLDGRVPDDIDDEQYNRGPWDAVFGWRDFTYEGGTYVDGSRSVVGGGNPGNRLSRRPSSNGQWTDREITGYRPFGPQSWMLRRIHWYRDDELFHTRLSMYQSRLTRYKSEYVWPRGQTRRVINPDWIIDWDTALATAGAGSSDIRETAYFAVEIKSKYPRTDSRFLTPGTWALDIIDPDWDYKPRIAYSNGWYRLDDSRKICDHVWRYEWEYQVYYDPEIGVPPEYETITNDDGTTTQVPVTQPVYRIDHFAFAGINVGPDASTDSPYTGFDPNASDAPAPTDLDHGTVDRVDEDARWQYLSYLGVARQTDMPQAWASRFRGERPYQNMVAIAQAKVFNNHSWDLWTQMWRAELEPVSNYEGWVDAIANGQLPDDVDPQDIEDLAKYFSATAPLASVMLGH